MKKTQILLLLLLVCKLSGFSQSTLKGTVKDSLQKPLQNANIIAQPQDSLKRMKFAITDELGRYQLELENSVYEITISFLGYASYKFNTDSKKDTTKNIELKEQDNRLDEVFIELPVMVKKDTITYNVDKFLTGNERKLKNILNNLPGVAVEKDGTITVNGKK
ncbi:carboxypeptidase-like regulatory domain-containing protein [Bizionia sediminis]|uniref:Carboxypeptidase-like regulatory domain-containing protein n=1 Tax=Bizionia sediminis TaxID=1737064 RepID=A0ABW5KSE8_9FLAO